MPFFRGSSQGRMLEWVAMPSSGDLPRQECWSGLTCPSSGDLPREECWSGLPCLLQGTFPGKNVGVGCHAFFRGSSQARILEWVTMPSSGDLPDPGIKPASPMSHALAGSFFAISTAWEVQALPFSEPVSLDGKRGDSLLFRNLACYVRVESVLVWGAVQL